MSQAGKTIGDAYTRKTQNKLYSDAYMGNPGAMEKLMQANPAMANQLQQQKQQAEQLKLQQSAKQEAGMKKLFTDNKEIIDQVVEDVAKFETFEEAQGYFDRKKEEHRPIFGNMLDNVQLTEQMWQESKTVHGDKGSSAAFEGKGMPAQVSSALVRGAEDPAFRNTAEYARAWDVANKPQIIDTEEGRIPLYPKINPIFKAPGAEKPEKEQVGSIKKSAEDDVKVIKGTEKKKTTADEKLSAGFLGRMNAAEENIKNLGKFDSANWLEKLKGVTNITASTELQQYRQAADDWIRSKLRRESGAVIAPEEMAKEYEIYFPQLGDGQPVLDQKKRARADAANAMKIAAGRAGAEKATEALPKGVTEEQIEYTMKKRGMTREQILNKLKQRGQ